MFSPLTDTASLIFISILLKHSVNFWSLAWCNWKLFHHLTWNIAGWLIPTMNMMCPHVMRWCLWWLQEQIIVSLSSNSTTRTHLQIGWWHFLECKLSSSKSSFPSWTVTSCSLTQRTHHLFADVWTTMQLSLLSIVATASPSAHSASMFFESDCDYRRSLMKVL